MPLEGQWQRAQTPLRKLSARERNAAVAVIAVTAIALVALLLATVGDSRPAPGQGCIRANVAGIVGAETISPCGQEAIEVCRRAARFNGDRSETIVAACRNAQIRF